MVGNIMRTSVTDGQADRQCGFDRDSRWALTKRFLEPLPWPQSMGWKHIAPHSGKWEMDPSILPQPGSHHGRVPTTDKMHEERENLWRCGLTAGRLENWQIPRKQVKFGIRHSVLVWCSKRDSECLCRWECISPENNIDSNLEPLREV